MERLFGKAALAYKHITGKVFYDMTGLSRGADWMPAAGIFFRLQEIDKSQYRKRFRVVFVAIVVVLTVVALGTSTLLIAIFGTPGESHFWLNLAGVVVGAATVVLILMRLRQHPYLHEVAYVWDLKQALNQIYRMQRKIEPLVEKNDPDAIATMYFFYRGSQQLYELDDNTITMDAIALKIRALERRIEALGITVTTDSYRTTMLDRFR